ncbi:MAG TPA: hypothetical protein VE476_00130 [Propionibacteriaceae bacterium]|jgi:hypothetical protein|nr:hypothetical protein [Propionibacteriaceae bacterium]
MNTVNLDVLSMAVGAGLLGTGVLTGVFLVMLVKPVEPPHERTPAQAPPLPPAAQDQP